MTDGESRGGASAGFLATTRADLWLPRLDGLLARFPRGDRTDEPVWVDRRAGVLLAGERLHACARPEGDASVIVFDGHVRNRGELTARPCPSATLGSADAEAVRQVLDRVGVVGLGDVAGEFALAWWDGRGGQLVLARDRWGSRPLYVLRHPDGGVTAASLLSVLLLAGLRVDPLGLGHHLAFGYTSPTATVYERVRKVEPGTGLVHAPAGGGVTRHVSLRRATGASMTPRAAIEQDVAGAGRVGVLVTDRILAAILACGAGGRVCSFALSFSPSPDTVPSTRGRDVEAVHLRATAADLARRAAPLTTSVGEPLGDPDALALDLVAAEAAARVDVVLSAIDPDVAAGGDRFGWTGWRRFRAAHTDVSVFRRDANVYPSLIAQLRTEWEVASFDANRRRVGTALLWRRRLDDNVLAVGQAARRHGVEARFAFLSGDGPPSDDLRSGARGPLVPPEVRAELRDVFRPAVDRVLRDHRSVLRSAFGPLSELRRLAARSERVAHRVAMIALWEDVCRIRS